jgi:subtilase family serine protease
LPNGTLASVACNTPFNYLNATNTTPVVVVAEGTSNSIATFTVTATKLSTGTVAISNSNKTTVSPVEKTVATPAKTKPKQAVVKPTSSYVAGSTVSTRTSNLYGSPDLQVRIINTPTNVRAGSAVSLQFVVENIGTNVTPSNWSFSASLPYQPVYTYQSPGQKALYPGDKIVYTLSYTATIPQYGNEVCTMQYPNYNCPTPDQAQWNTPYSTMGGYPYTAGYGTSQSASVTVDPMQYIAESNKANNYASVTYPIY